MESLLEYLMNKVDYNDKDAVYLVYQLYAVSKEDGCTFAQLKDVLHNRENNVQCPEKDSAEMKIKRTGGNAGDTGKNIGIYGAEAMEEVSDIPVVMEKVEGEAELPCYSMKTYLTAIGCILGGVLVIIISMLTKILYNPFGNRIDYSKLAALLLVLFCLEGYALSKIFDKMNKITKIVKTTEYIDPTEDYVKKTKADVREIGKVTEITGSRPDIGSSDNLSPQNKSRFKNDWNEAPSTDCGEDEVSAPTCLLNASIENANRPVLKAQEGAGYKDIPILSFPFFIGKLKKNVDYCLDNDMVSRYHAKITREGEFYYLTDLNSTNGTYINQELLQTYQKKKIRFGDEISFANIRYRFMQV
jgi:hypothetical protein